MVSGLSIGLIIFGIVFAIAIPTILAIVFKVKYKSSLKVFFIGCAVWFVFAMILEQILHTLVLLSPAGKAIQNNIWLYGIYAGLAAAVFEETGRFLAMKFLLKKYYDNFHNALMYGAGHGGFEAMFLLGLGMLNNLIYALMINAGQIETLLEPLGAKQKETMQQAIDGLISTPAYMFLLGDFERVFAVILHISFSVLVWIAVVKGKKSCLWMAFVFHFVVDAVTVIVSGNGVPAWALEIIVFVMAVLTAVFANKMWKKNLKE